LDALRRSGDAPSVELAVEHLRNVGPVDAVARAVGHISPHNWTHTAAQANFEFLSVAGELLPEAEADTWISWCANLLDSESSDFVRNVRPTFLYDFAAAKAISSLLSAGGPSGHRRVAELVASWPTPLAPILEPVFKGWIDILDHPNISMEVRERLLARGLEHEDDLATAILGWMARHGETQAADEVLARVRSGDLRALLAVNDVQSLSAESAQQFIQLLEPMVNSTLNEASESVWSGSSIDAPRLLVFLNCWFPDEARWEAIVRLLSHPNVAADHKRGALQLVVGLADRVPEPVLRTLGESSDALARTPAIDLFGTDMGGLPTTVEVVAGALRGEAADAAVGRLALGSSRERRDAATLLGTGWCERMRPILVSLAADEVSTVGSAAANAVGRLTGSFMDEVILTLAEHCASDSGVMVPSALWLAYPATRPCRRRERLSLAGSQPIGQRAYVAWRPP
jgi:hypothetical protein